MSTDNAPPSRTLFCSNLDTKISKPDLIRNLYLLFSTYGPVLDVVALKTMKMRGQAHVVFPDYQSSANALKQLQGNQFFGREMRLFYAKSRSNVLTRLEGGVGASLAAEAKAGPSLFRSLPAVVPTGTTSAGKSIFNAAGGPATSSDTQSSKGLSIKPPGSLLEAPNNSETPISPGRKRQREASFSGDADESRKKSPIPPMPQSAITVTDSVQDGPPGSEEDDDDEMEMSDEDE